EHRTERRQRRRTPLSTRRWNGEGGSRASPDDTPSSLEHLDGRVETQLVGNQVAQRCLNQSTVCLRPSSNLVVATQPKSRLAFSAETSRQAKSPGLSGPKTILTCSPSRRRTLSATCSTVTFSVPSRL